MGIDGAVVMAVLGAAPPEERLNIAEWKPTWEIMTETAYSPTLLILIVILATVVVSEWVSAKIRHAMI